MLFVIDKPYLQPRRGARQLWVGESSKLSTVYECKLAVHFGYDDEKYVCISKAQKSGEASEGNKNFSFRGE